MQLTKMRSIAPTPFVTLMRKLLLQVVAGDLYLQAFIDGQVRFPCCASQPLMLKKLGPM